MANGNDSSTIFLLQAADDATLYSEALVDTSATEHSLDSTSDARIVDEAGGDDPKFGNRCIEVAANKSVMFDGETASVGMEDGGFTVDGWYYFTDVSGFNGYPIIYGATSDDPLSVRLYNSTLTFKIMDTIVQTLSVSSLIYDDGWYHLAFERDDDGQCYIFVDGDVGTQVYTTANTDELTWGTSTTKQIEVRGTTSGTEDVYVEELRISSNSRYGGEDFTPETTAYSSTPSGPIGTISVESEASVEMETFNTGGMTVESEVSTVSISGTIGAYGSMSVESEVATIESEGWTTNIGNCEIEAETSVEITGNISVYANIEAIGLGSVESTGVVPVVGGIELEAFGRARLVENVIFGSMSVESHVASVEMAGDVLDPVFGGIAVDVIAAIKMNGYIAVDEAELWYTRNQCSFTAGELSAVSSSETELGYSRTSSCG